jgi:hypothetical protein
MDRTIRRYLLLDPQQHDPAMEGESHPRRALEQLVKSVPPKVYLLGGRTSEKPLQEKVRLYALDDDKALLEASRAWSTTKSGWLSVCGWLESWCSLHQLGHYLDRLMIQAHPRHGRVALRYFDPRTLHHLSHLLTAKQLESFLGPVLSWEYLDINGYPQMLQGPGALKGRLTLEPDQWASLERLDKINLCLRGWRHNTGLAPLPGDAPTRVDYFLKLAEGYGLCAETELIAFVLHGLGTTERFDQHPLMAKVLWQCQHEGKDYLSLTETFSEKDWMAISGEKFKEEQI